MDRAEDVNENPSDPYDPNGDPFYAVVGRCIAAWSDVEKRVFEICSHLMRCDLDVVAIVYYRTPSLDARLTLTDEFVKLRLQGSFGPRPDPAVKAWNELRSRITSLLSVRNRLAHHPVSTSKIIVENSLSDRGQVRQELFILHNSMSEQETLRGRKIDQQPLYLGDL